jgi:hypothetical protein
MQKKSKRLELTNECIDIFRKAAKLKMISGGKPLMEQVLETYALKLKSKMYDK